MGNYTRTSTRLSIRVRDYVDFTRQSVTNYIGNYSRFSPNYGGGGVYLDYSRSSVGTATLSFLGDYVGNYNRTFIGDYTGDFNRTFIGDYSRNFIGNYSRNFVGNYVGTTIDTNTSTVETYTLYLRSA